VQKFFLAYSFDDTRFLPTPKLFSTSRNKVTFLQETKGLEKSLSFFSFRNKDLFSKRKRKRMQGRKKFDQK
jgi:hypothetical protein